MKWLLAACLLGCSAEVSIKSASMESLEPGPAMLIDVSPFCTLTCQIDGQNVVRWNYFGNSGKCPVGAPNKELLTKCLHSGSPKR